MRQNEKQEEEVAALGDLSRDELVARWVKVYGCPPPKGLKRGLLERAAAWHLQAKALCGLSPNTKKQLKVATRRFEDGIQQELQHAAEIGRQAAGALSESGASLSNSKVTDSRFGSSTPLTPGMRLLREWNGRQHFVDVVEGGFVLDGKTYRSLSAIARRITGAHWSGPRFFGL